MSFFLFQVARLAKFWNSTILYNGSQFKRSYRFELLGVKAGQEEEDHNKDHPSIFRAFRLFLIKVETIDQQEVIFTDFYDKTKIPDYIEKQRPLLMDPTNPFHNLMVNFDLSVQQLFSKYATESLKRLNHGFPDFKSLFQPQPVLVNVDPEIDHLQPVKWLISSESRANHFNQILKLINLPLTLTKKLCQTSRKFSLHSCLLLIWNHSTKVMIKKSLQKKASQKP